MEDAILLIEKIETYLRYGQVPTQELISRLCESEGIRSLTFLKNCYKKMERGDAFPTAWRTSLEEWNNTKLKQEDKKALYDVADILGSSDYESQINALDLTEVLLKQGLEDAVKEKETGGKLYRSLGILFGIGAAIFMA